MPTKRVEFTFRTGGAKSFYLDDYTVDPKDDYFELTDIFSKYAVVFKEDLRRIEIWEQEPPPEPL